MRVLRGNDILINWSVFYDAGGVKTNVDFSNSTLSVFILDSYGKRAVEHTVSGNVISIHYGGEIQRLGTIAIDAYWQNNNTLVWSRAKKNEVVELVDNPESVTLDGIPTDISITTINTSSDTFFGGTYNANFSNYYTKEEIDNKIISDYNFLANKPLVYDEETGKYTAVDVPINFVNNINIGNFAAGVSGINFTANGSGEVGTLTIRDRLIVNGVEITGSGTGGLDVENMWNVLGSADDSDKQINVVHLTDALSGYLQTTVFDDLFEKVNIGTLETPKYAIKAKYDFYSIGEVSAFGAGSTGSSGGGLIQTVYGISGLSTTHSDANLTETFNAAAIKKIYDDVVTLQSGSLINYSVTGTGNAITGVSKTESSLNFVKGSTFSLNGHTHTFGDINGLPTTLGGYGITDGVTTTVFNTLVNEFNTHVTSDVHLTTTQKNILAHLQIVEGKLQADIDFYSTGEVSAFGAGSGSSSGGGLIQTVYGYSSLGNSFNNATLTDTFNAYTINQLHARLSQVEVGAAVNVAVGGAGNAITGVTKNGNVLEFTKDSTFSLAGHTHDYIPLSQKGTANGVATLDANGLIISAQLPSYVDDVIEVSSYANLPTVGESGKIYVTTDTNITYRWTGTIYVEISKSIALGETSSTAYRGDLGAIAYAHSQIAGGTGVHISGTERTNWNIAYTNSHTHANKSLLDAFSQSDNDVLNHLSIVDGKLKVDIDLYSLGEISAFGAGSGTGGSGLIQSVYGLSGLGGVYSDATLTDTFNAYTINSLHDRINSLESGSALNFSTTGTGNVITSVTKSGTSVSVVKGLTAVLEGDTRLTNSRPNPYALTFSGYSTATYDGSAAVTVALPTKVSQLTNDSGYLTSIDADLVAIAALTGTSGLLRKTAANTWSLDTNAYLTSITKAQVEGVLTGNITTHTHSQYLTGNQTITVSGDATGSGATSIALTLANSGVVAGTYNNVATQVRPFTVDAKGRVTGIGTAVTITPAWSSVTGKPTTISGYGITDAYTKTQTDSFLALKLDKTTFSDLFEKVNIGTTALPIYAIKAKYNFYSVGEVSAFGAGAGSGSSGLIQTVYGYSGLGGTYSDTTLTDTFNAYTINKINTDLSSRITSLEAGSALTFTTTGTGNAITSVTKSGTSVTVTKGLTFSVDGHTHSFASLTSKPTTLSGYGITDAYTKTLTDSTFLKLAGGTVTGNIILKGSTSDDMTDANIHPRLRFDNSNSSQTVSFIFTDYDAYRTPAGIKLVGNQGNEWFEAPKLIKTGSSDSYVLLGGGGHKAISDFALSHNHPYLPLAGGTMTGALNFKNGTWNNVGDDVAIGDINVAGQLGIKALNTANPGIAFYNNSAVAVGNLISNSGTLQWNGNTIWHSGNDGNGNGLDADLLDGVHYDDIAHGKYLGSGSTSYYFFIPFYRYDAARDGNVVIGTFITSRSGSKTGVGVNASNVIEVFSKNQIWQTGSNDERNYILLKSSSDGGQESNIYFATAMYNGQLWYGLRIFNFQDYGIYFKGYSSNTLIPIAYYKSYGGESILNSEIYNSITKVNPTNSISSPYYNYTKLALITDNVASATKLQTARSIWGQSFDGTGNISGNLEMGGYTISGTAGKIFFGGNFHIDSISDNDLFLNYYNSTNIYMNYGATRGNTIFGGNVGIGGVDSNYKLNIVGSLKTTGTVYTNVGVKSRNICIETDNNGNASTASSEINNFNEILYLQHKTSNGLVMCVGGGNVSIGTNAVGSYKLDVNGTLRATGAVTLGSTLSALSIGVANSDATTGRGLSLYGGSSGSKPTFGIMFAGTSTFGTHGGVTSDWATYLTMSDTLNRGWIFQRGSTNVASISGGGVIAGSAIQTSTDSSYYSLIQRNGGGNALYVQQSSTSMPDIASFRYGSATAGAGTEVLAVKSTGINVTGTATISSTVTAPTFTVGTNCSITTTAAYLGLRSSGNEMTIGGSTTMHVNYRAALGGTPTTWYWRAGTSTSFADFNVGSLTAKGYVEGSRFCTGYDTGIANSISCSAWFRSNGTTGWINDTYGGGINMTDTTYVRVHNNKAFWVNNNIVATGEITAFGASDIRLKSNIKQINSALDFLSKVKTYEFDWNEKAIELNPLKAKRGAGVIAQEMNLLDKNFVHSIYGDYLGVDYERFIPYLIGGVNEVADEVTILKKRVAELELEIKQLKK